MFQKSKNIRPTLSPQEKTTPWNVQVASIRHVHKPLEEGEDNGQNKTNKVFLALQPKIKQYFIPKYSKWKKTPSCTNIKCSKQTAQK